MNHTTAGESVQAWIDVRQLNQNIRVIPYCQSDTPLLIDYELVSNKSGLSGHSRSQQSGSLQLKPGIKNALSRLEISISRSDTYQLELNIYNQGRLIASDTVTVPTKL